MLIINCLFSIGKKGSSGVCGVEMWKKSTVGIPQFPSLPLKSCCRPLLVALFIGGMLYHYNKIWCSCSGCIFFSGWECFWPLSGKDYSNERAISLRFVRLILSQYKSENYFQNVTTMVTVANISYSWWKNCMFGVISIYVWERKDREVLLLLGN